MCLVVLSSERFELRAYSETQKDKAEIESGIEETMMKKKKRDGCSSSRALAEAEVVRWERVLPRMMLKVMLVEADDSTRQIIVALLRKCSYNVVAVPDGLKAWEILKGKPHDIDLILTEVDLPSISGFVLLALIMEHEICKSIPVIMMSSQDSISTVYKCMMRGAADYLVKPIRRNELTNMWQHVWRRRQLSTENGLIDQSVSQEKIEGTSENHVASSHSNCYMECNQRNKEQLDKGNDAQSSCTKQDLEVDHIHVGGDMQESSSDVGMPKHIACINFGILNGSETKDANMTSEACDNNDPIANCRDATDLLGAFNSHPNCCHRTISLSNGASKFDSTPHLNLSLSGSSSSGFENHFIEKRATLGHSNASAFTQYINKPLQPLSTTANASDQEKECRGNAEKCIDDVVTGYNYNSGTLGSALNMQKGTITLASDQSYPSEIAPSCPQKRAFPIPVPLSVKGTSYSSTYMGYSTVLPPIFPSQSVENNKSEQLYEQFCQKGNCIRDQTVEKLEQKMDCMEDRRKISSATDKSGGSSSSSSSLCNGTGSQINSIGGYRNARVSSSNIDHVAIGQSASANKNQENFVALDGNSHWSIQREAAIRKFQMKRKDRCFEKKVRYESRKKLADQRPRVKGQFVRRQGQVGALLVAETDGNKTKD